jgi:hypothetical protein
MRNISEIIVDAQRPAILRAALTIALFLMALAQTRAGTINAASPSLSDVVAAVALASDGDTVAVPAGTASWKSTLTLTKAITLQGATTVTGPMSDPTVDRQTVITDDVPSTVNSGNVIILSTSSGVVRVTGITLQAGTGTGNAIHCAAVTPNFRIDHCEFLSLPSYTIWVLNERGVIDHNVAQIIYTFFEPHPTTWGGGSYGDNSYSSPLELGSDHAVYAEDNYVQNLDTTSSNIKSIVDSQAGARYVMRNNTLIDAHFSTHGTESGGRPRGPRSWEIYNNTITRTLGALLANNAMATRGGTGIVFGNTVTGNFSLFNRLQNFRDMDEFAPWGGSDGTSGWDINDTASHTGNGFGGGAGGLFASGTHSGANGATTLTVSGTPWTTNQWAKYSIKNTDTGRFSEITSNTSNTLTYKSSAFGDPLLMTFNTGQHFEIRKVYHALDHVGAGQCDPLSGDDPPPHWLNQIREPAYLFSNTMNGANALATSDYNLVENLDFYNQTLSFNGTVGVGVGTLAQRPATCTKGVAYWATDQGEWDSTHSGPDGQLYVATATNTWTLYYTPYTYPHPLTVGGEGSQPGAPQNLTIVQ